jgi:hypothetical protein
MNKPFILFSIVMCLAVNACLAQVITPVDSRQNMLSGMRTTLQNVDAEAADYSAVRSPFVVPSKKEPEPVATKDLGNVPVSSGIGEVLPDAKALQVISRQFQPFGSLVMGDRGVLQLANGRTIAEGDVFKAEIQGVVYQVEIGDVTSKGYSLSLGTATVQRTFLTTTGSTSQ